MVAIGCKVVESYHIENVSHLNYYFIVCFSPALSFCCSVQGVSFEEPEPGEVVDVEVVLDT